MFTTNSSNTQLAKSDSSDTPPCEQDTLQQLREKLEQVPAPLLALTAFALGSAVTVSTTLLYARYGKRLRNSDWITPNVIARKRWIKGVVTA